MTTSADHSAPTTPTPPKEHRMTDTETTEPPVQREPYPTAATIVTTLLLAGLACVVYAAVADNADWRVMGLLYTGFGLALGAAYALVRWAAR